jgi:hypothetical protein
MIMVTSKRSVNRLILQQFEATARRLMTILGLLIQVIIFRLPTKPYHRDCHL